VHDTSAGDVFNFFWSKKPFVNTGLRHFLFIGTVSAFQWVVCGGHVTHF
jgi:hypothetical protein